MHFLIPVIQCEVANEFLIIHKLLLTTFLCRSWLLSKRFQGEVRPVAWGICPRYWFWNSIVHSMVPSLPIILEKWLPPPLLIIFFRATVLEDVDLYQGSCFRTSFQGRAQFCIFVLTHNWLWLIVFIRALAEAEIQTNIEQSETFKLPSGQEIEKEDILFYKFTLII